MVMEVGSLPGVRMFGITFLSFHAQAQAQAHAHAHAHAHAQAPLLSLP